MDKNNKKLIAATSAVFRYIQQEEEAIYTQPFSAAGDIAGANVPAARFRVWGLSGRQAQMQMRNLMQMKAFHGTKFM